MKFSKLRSFHVFATLAALCTLFPVGPAALQGSAAGVHDAGLVSPPKVPIPRGLPSQQDPGVSSSASSPAAIASAFRARVEKLPASEYSQSCPHSFADGLLDEYIGALGRSDVERALEALWKMDVQLGCVSAARFAGLHGAFRDTVLADATGEAAERLFPVVLLFLEYGGGSFRADYLGWLRSVDQALIAALTDSRSRLAELGLMLQDRNGLVRVTGQPAQQLVSEIGGNGLDSGRCTLLELEELEGEGGRTVSFCPKDCREPLLAQDDEAEGRLAGVLPPDVAAECQRRQQEKERLRASKSGWSITQCMEEFDASNPSMLACQVEGLTGYREARLHVGERERTTEDIYARRRCMVGQYDRLSRYRSAADHLRYSLDLVERSRRNWENAVEQVRTFDENFDHAAAAVRGKEPELHPRPGHDVEAFNEAREAYEQADEALTNAVNQMIEAYQTLARLVSEMTATQDCAADGTGCSDTCGIQDALAAMAEGCVDEMTPSEAPELGDTPAPDPHVSMPDPRGPGYVPGSNRGAPAVPRERDRRRRAPGRRGLLRHHLSRRQGPDGGPRRAQRMQLRRAAGAAARVELLPWLPRLPRRPEHALRVRRPARPGRVGGLGRQRSRSSAPERSLPPAGELSGARAPAATGTPQASDSESTSTRLSMTVASHGLRLAGRPRCHTGGGMPPQREEPDHEGRTPRRRKARDPGSPRAGSRPRRGARQDQLGRRLSLRPAHRAR